LSFEIKNEEGLRRIMLMAQGLDPDQRQALTDFLKFDNNIERTNLPTRKDVQRVIFCSYAGLSLFPDIENDPFTEVAEVISTVFMAKGGDKSKQFVELMKQTPSLSDLQMYQEPEKLSLRERVFGRRGSE